jgi:formyltetrahydrofolate hydrolase
MRLANDYEHDLHEALERYIGRVTADKDYGFYNLSLLLSIDIYTVVDASVFTDALNERYMTKVSFGINWQNNIEFNQALNALAEQFNNELDRIERERNNKDGDNDESTYFW